MNGKICTFLTMTAAVLVMAVLVPQKAYAETVYESDNREYDEGYIILGESHACLAAAEYAEMTDDEGNVKDLNDVVYHFKWDDSVATDENGNPDTFTMSGNLFFVYQGNAQADGPIQTSREFIYSDGHGKMGRGVEKIHEIIDKNPGIRHWNILSYHGSMSALNGAELVPYYIDCYNNWIEYEFPEASIYFLSHSTMTQYYKQNKKAYKFDEGIKEEYPGRFYDFTDYYEARYPDHTIDAVHWDAPTYITMFNIVINNMQEKRHSRCQYEPIRTDCVLE